MLDVYDLGRLVSVAAIWGASYLFIRVGSPEFGVAAMAGVRAVTATLLMLPLLLWRGHWRAARIRQTSLRSSPTCWHGCVRWQT